MIGPTCERAFLTRTTVYRAREICIGIVSADVVLAGTDFGSARLRFARDSPLEGDGFELPVPGALSEAERARRGKITDPLFSFVSLAYGYPATSCVGINPKNLNRPPKR